MNRLLIHFFYVFIEIPQNSSDNEMKMFVINLILCSHRIEEPFIYITNQVLQIINRLQVRVICDSRIRFYN